MVCRRRKRLSITRGGPQSLCEFDRGTRRAEGTAASRCDVSQEQCAICIKAMSVAPCFDTVLGITRVTALNANSIASICCGFVVKKRSTFICRHLHEHDQKRFTIRSGVLTGNDTRWRSASSGNP